MAEDIKYYSPQEERINIISHAIGVILGIIALPFLIIRATHIDNGYPIISFTIYGVSMILLYTASTLFHAAKSNKLAEKLNVFDHASIFVLIAGTYTPFALVTLYGTKGWIVFGLTWGFALIGVISKFFSAGKYRLISTAMYLLMGWLMLFFIRTFLHNIDLGGALWVLAGGILYSVGSAFYYFRNRPFNHAIFHFFVLGGSICHFIAVYCYVK